MIWRGDLELVSSEWDKFMAPPERGTGGGPRRSPAPPDPEDGSVSDLVVILEAMLDVKDIVQLEPDEATQFRNALAHFDREASIGSWSRAEPAALRAWRRGVVRRAATNDVAAAIVHALMPYHALLRTTAPASAFVTLHLPAMRVAIVRRRAVMTAWFEQMTQIAACDPFEQGAWMRYWIIVSSPMGTRADTITWLRGVEFRSRNGSDVALRVLEAVQQRDEAMRVIDHATAEIDWIEVEVPGVQ